MPKSRRKEVEIVKTIVYLEADAHNELRHLAVDERVSMSELVRRAVDEFLKKKKSKKGGKEQ